MQRLYGFILITMAFTGCSSYKTVTVEDRETISPQQQIYKIETTAGQFVEFESDPLGYALLKSGGIERLLPDGTTTTIPLSTVKTIYTKETTFLSTTGGIILISSVAAILLVFVLWPIALHGG